MGEHEHAWRFWGDDPYIVCHTCDEIRDALNGRMIKAGRFWREKNEEAPGDH